MELREDTRYTYAVARIRALETHFLNLEKIQRIIESSDAPVAWRETAGWHFLQARELSNENIEGDIERFLFEETEYTKNLFLSLSNDPELTNIFLLKYDFHNLKILLKTSLVTIDHPINDTLLERGIVKLGLIPIEELRKAIIEEDLRILPGLLQESAREILKAIKTNVQLFRERPDMVDILIDKKMFGLIFKILEESPAPSSFFLNILFQTEVDICNLNICRRIKYLKRSKDFLNETLIPGGKLSIKFFLDKYENYKDDPFNEFINSQLSTLNSQLHSLYESTLYTAFGLEPLVAFLKKREKEATIIRMIILAKLQGLTHEEILMEINTVSEGFLTYE